MRSAEHRWLDRLGIKYQTADPYGGAELKYDIQNIDCADRQYDVVICNHVLEHVADWHKALREVYRVLWKIFMPSNDHILSSVGPI